MTNKEFIEEVKDTFVSCSKLLTEKGRIYGLDGDRLGQLKLIGVLCRKHATETTYTLVSKHFVALGQMLENPVPYSDEDFDNYILDIINYMVLIRSLLKDR
jgi:hypothetical protein